MLVLGGTSEFCRTLQKPMFFVAWGCSHYSPVVCGATSRAAGHRGILAVLVAEDSQQWGPLCAPHGCAA